MIQKNLDEIKNSKLLQYFGGILIALHAATAWFWLNEVSLFNKNHKFYCWPLWQNCETWNHFFLSHAEWIVFSYFFLSIFALILALQCRFSHRLLYFSLFFLTLIKLVIFSADYRFSGNYHYMLDIVYILFLFFPRKEQVIPFMIVLFYLIAGMLKFDLRWLTGNLYISPIWIQGKLLEWASAYVILLECLWVWGLFSSRLWVFSITLAQLLFFHFFSWHVVGFFYPTTMLGLLSFFIISRCLNKTLEFNCLKKPSVFLPLVFIVFAQLIPHFYQGDPRITREGTLFAINMMDIRSYCESFISQKKEGQILDYVTSTSWDLGYRLGCDPFIHFQEAQHQCQDEKTELTWKMIVRPSEKENPIEVVSTDQVCNKNIQYSIWKSNSWLKTK